MLTQGVIDQSPVSIGTRRNSLVSSDRVLETNIENLLRMVSKDIRILLLSSI